MLINNILFLRERHPAIREYYSEHEEHLDLELFESLESKAGCKTIRYSAGERPLMIHSMYDPKREAERLIASHEDKITENTHVFFYGIGMGYHVDQFLEKFPNQSYSLYEPIPEVFFELSNHRELKNIINKNMRSLYIDKHNEESFAYLDEFTTSNQNIHLIVLPSYKNIVEDKYTDFHKNIKEVILNRRTNLHTDASFQKLWVTNSLLNFKTVLNTPNILKDIDRNQFEGKPAMIVSAGPSLAEDIEHIRYIKEKNLAYIFSVGSAINSLIEYGVLPDAVFTYDPSEKNKNVFEKMISRNLDNIPMVFGSSVGYETIEKYKGPKVHFITSQDRTSLYFLKDQLSLEHDLILDSPSIAVMTFQILNKLGADPIIFAGQNLGYLYDRIYSKGINYKHHTKSFIENLIKNSIKTKDVYKNEIKTTIGFNNMRESIERFAELYQDKTFINTTKGGADIKGIPFKPIEEVVKETLTHSIDKKTWWVEDNGYNQQDIDHHLEKLIKSEKEFVITLASFEKVLGYISLYTKIKNESNVLNELTKFDKLYNRLVENSYYNEFLSFYIRTHVKYLSNELKRLNAETDVLVKGNEIVPIFTRFIEQCRQGSLELEKIVEENIFK